MQTYGACLIGLLPAVIGATTYPNTNGTTDGGQVNRSYNSFIMDVGMGSEPIWQKKQFAGKLKEMVCLLIGCTMEQLEDNDFKEKDLGEEWIRYGYGE